MTPEPADPSESEVTDPWSNHVPDPDLGGPEFAGFLECFRDLQDAVARSNPPVAVWAEMEEALRSFVDRLRPFNVEERHQPAGNRRDLPGRGHPFLVPFITEVSTEMRVEGRVTFRRFHLGGHGAAHGGALPLFFDEILGHLSNAGDRATARTAYLTVNYRHITPIDRELRFESTYDREEGRKRWLSGRLYDGSTLVADAEGLFVVLLPGQP
jgi:acyl-coenzyme A thioesterase PaaI-like protein